MQTRKVAFIGLGTMGRPMVANLLAAGYDVSSPLHGKPGRYGDLVAAGLRLTPSPASAVAGAECVFTMLPTGAEVESVLFGDDGAIGGLEDSSLVIDMSTVGPRAATDLAARASAEGATYVDAPVSGGPAKAREGTLTFIVGGDDESVERARPLLEPMAAQIFHAGPLGTGQAAKACNNLLVGDCMLANAEALTLGAAWGLDPAELTRIVQACTGTNWQLENLVPQTILRDDFDPRFALGLLRKDLDLAAAMSEESESPSPVGDLVREYYRRAQELVGSGADFSAVIKVYENGERQ